MFYNISPYDSLLPLAETKVDHFLKQSLDSKRQTCSKWTHAIFATRGKATSLLSFYLWLKDNWISYKDLGDEGGLRWAVRHKGSGLYIHRKKGMQYKTSFLVATRTNVISYDSLTNAEGGRHPVTLSQFPSKPKTLRLGQGQQPRSSEAAQPLVYYPELAGSSREGNTE